MVYYFIRSVLNKNNLIMHITMVLLSIHGRKTHTDMDKIRNTYKDELMEFHPPAGLALFAS